MKYCGVRLAAMRLKGGADEIRRDCDRLRSGREPALAAVGDRGWHVALVERKHLGGTCINTGCTPTKGWPLLLGEPLVSLKILVPPIGPTGPGFRKTRIPQDRSAPQPYAARRYTLRSGTVNLQASESRRGFEPRRLALSMEEWVWGVATPGP
jgi:hypothetical protein